MTSPCSVMRSVPWKLPGGALFWPWSIDVGAPFRLAGAYGVAAAILLLIGGARSRGEPAA